MVAEESQAERDDRLKREFYERQVEARRSQPQHQARSEQATEDWQKQSGHKVEDYQDYSTKQAAGGRDTLEDIREQKQAARRLNVFRRVAKAKESGEIGELSLSDLKSMQDTIKHLQNVYRVINGASAATIWGLILTFIIMNCQLFLGNGLRIPFIPKLNKFELVLLGLVDFIILMAAIVQTFLIAMYASMVYYITVEPIEALKSVFEGDGAISSLFGLIKNLFGND